MEIPLYLLLHLQSKYFRGRDVILNTSQSDGHAGCLDSGRHRYRLSFCFRSTFAYNADSSLCVRCAFRGRGPRGVVRCRPANYPIAVFVVCHTLRGVLVSECVRPINILEVSPIAMPVATSASCQRLSPASREDNDGGIAEAVGFESKLKAASDIR